MAERAAEQGTSETGTREWSRQLADRATRAMIELTKSAKSARVRVSAAKAVLRGDTTLADKRTAIAALVEVMDAAKSESARLSAAKEVLRVSRVPADSDASAAKPRPERREAPPLPPALAALLARSAPAPAGKPWAVKPWQRGTALQSGTVQLPR